MRKGPHPLPVHLGMIAANMSDMNSLVPKRAKISHDQAVEMIRGIQLYQNHPYKAPKPQREVVWQKGGMTISKPYDVDIIQNAQSLLIVPSLINGSEILDITPDQSFLNYCYKRAINAYLFDWGDLAKSGDDNITMDELVTDRLVDGIRGVSNIAGATINVMGYCMGGTLILGSIAFASSYMRSMTLVATPWDFHAPSFDFAKQVRVSRLPQNVMGGGFDGISSTVLQSFFAAIDSQASVQKFADFARMDQDSERAKLFIAVEDWINGGGALPQNIAQHCIHEWFENNKPLKGEWVLNRKKVNLKRLPENILSIYSSRDKIVPMDAVEPFVKVTNGNKIILDCGHVGLMVGRNAREKVWKPICDFVQKNNSL